MMKYGIITNTHSESFNVYKFYIEIYYFWVLSLWIIQMRFFVS